MKNVVTIGQRQTKQRNAIVEFLKGCTCPLTAEEIHRNLVLSYGQISLSTVYRNLVKLEKAGFVSGVKLGFEESVRFQLSTQIHDHHFTCRNCRKTIPLEFCPIEALKGQVEGEKFRVDGHSFEVWGRCSECVDS